MKNSSGSLDTNVILRLLLNDIPDQHLAVLNLFNDSSALFSVSDLAIVEVAFVLERYYELSRDQITEMIDGLGALSQINCNRALIERVLPIFLKNSKLSFEDCCLAVYAELNNALPLWTLDNKLASQVEGVSIVLNNR